ncbi:MAG: translocation/assembly module TamB domain-containing protein [Acidobacteriota bacterium]
MSNIPEPPTKEVTRLSRRKLIIIISLSILAVSIMLLLGGVYYIRTGRLNRYIAREVVNALSEYGVRAEIERLELSWSPRTVRMREIKLYNQQNGNLIATIAKADLTVKIREPYALRLRREIIFQQLDLNDVDLRLSFDTAGASNLDGLHQPSPRAPSRISFDYSSLTVRLSDGSFRLEDQMRDITGELAGLVAQGSPLPNRETVSLQLRSGTGNFLYQRREGLITAIDLAGNLQASGAEIERLHIDSSIGDLNAHGSLTDWLKPRYHIETQARVGLDALARVFMPSNRLQGNVSFQGLLQGEGAHYQLSGGITANEVVADNTRLRGVRINNFTLKSDDKRIDFTGRQVQVAMFVTEQATMADMSLSDFRGEQSGDVIHITAARVAISRLNFAQNQLLEMALRTPDFVLNKQHYQLRAAVNLGSGKIGSLHIGNTRGQLVADNDTIKLDTFDATLLGGRATGQLNIETARGDVSQLQARFADLDTAQLYTLLAPSQAPLRGNIVGRVELNWPGIDIHAMNGTIEAQLHGQTSTSADTIPLTGDIYARAQRGELELDRFKLMTDTTTLTAQGRVSLTGNADLQFTIASTRAREVQTILSSLGSANQIFADYDLQLDGELKFTGRVSGSFKDPALAGSLSIGSVNIYGEALGSLSGQLLFSPTEVRFENGQLIANQGGRAQFSYHAPRAPTATEGQLDLVFENIQFDRSFLAGKFSGSVNLTGLPASAQGSARIKMVEGAILGQSVKSAQAELIFDRETARLVPLEVSMPQAELNARGSLNLRSLDFEFQGQACQIDLAQLSTALNLTAHISGTVDTDFHISGNLRDTEQLAVNVNGEGRNIVVEGRAVEALKLTAQTLPEGRIGVNLNATIAGRMQSARATLDLRQPGRPILIESDLENFDIAPLVAAFAPELGTRLSGSVTGKLRLSGPTADDEILSKLQGNLQLTVTALKLAGRDVNIETPINISFNNAQINLPPTRVQGEGMDLAIGGTIGLSGAAELDFAVNGTANLEKFNLANSDLFLGGQVVIDARIAGTAADPQLTGQVQASEVSFSNPALGITLEEGKGRIVFSGNQATLESFTARANDGEVRVNGAMTFVGWQPNQWQFQMTASEMALLFQGVLATISVEITLTGTPAGQELKGTANIVQAEYTANIDLNNMISGPGTGGSMGFDLLAGIASPSYIPPVHLDVKLTAHDSLLIRNDQISTVASMSLNLAGTLEQPNLNGRITLQGGTIKFRSQRYEITTGSVELPAGSGASPFVNLLAEGDVGNYHVQIGIIGPVDDLDVTLRADPELTRAEILALVATGHIEPGTLGTTTTDSALGTAASLLLEEFISRPIGQQTEQLLGISRFQLDPILRPDANPAARLTVGQQITRKLSLTYSTNLSAEQDQTVLGEYDFSRRFSALATFSQGGTSARAGRDDNEFTFGVRGRTRFSLGFKNPTIVPSSPRANVTPAAKSAVNVIVNLPKGVDISKEKRRELLPLMREGFSRPLLRLGERNLTNYLQERGYFFAEVSAHCQPTNCNDPNAAVFYDVELGERLALAEIRIEGTELLTKKDLESELQSKEASLLGGIPLFKSLPLIGGSARGITSNDRLRHDRELIRRRLVDLGFRSARVDTRLAFKRASDDLLVIFQVEEGPRAMVVEIVLQGNTLFSTTELRAEMPINEGEPFSPTEVRESQRALKDYYARQGYLDTNAELDIADLNDNRVRLIYSLNEGARAIVKEIVVQGQTKTSVAAITRFFAFQPGDVLTPEKLQRTQRDLYATGAFREIDIDVEPLPEDSSAPRRVIVNVVEAKPLLAVYGIGYSTDDGPRALLELTNTNLFGLVNTASLRLRGSPNDQLIQFQFIDQRPFGYRWPVTFSAFYDRNTNLRAFTRRLLNNSGERIPPVTFGLSRFATFIQLERKLAETTSLRLRYNFENTKLINAENIPTIELGRTQRSIRLAMFSVGISRDKRDSALDPTQGQLLSIDHSLAARILGGNESFNKFFFNYQRYEKLPASVPLLRGAVIAMAARIGLAAPFNRRDGEGEDLLPISERFFAGGATTLRGFRFEEAGPQAILEPRTPAELPTLVPVGGNALTVFNFELRYPLAGRLELVPFYDLGNVFPHVRDISFGQMTNSIGLGLRVRTPLGPIGIDYGYLLDPPSFVTATGGLLRPRRGVIHIKFGQNF